MRDMMRIEKGENSRAIYRGLRIYDEKTAYDIWRLLDQPIVHLFTIPS